MPDPTDTAPPTNPTDPPALAALDPAELRARILATAVGTGLLEVLVKSLLDLHRAEADQISLGHEDCEECDDYKHDAVVCFECLGQYEEYWSPVIWPCPTVQHIADKLRVYPDRAGLLRAVPDAT